MMTSTLRRFSTLAAAACFAALLTSCETTGGGHISSTDPEVVKAKAALLASLEDYTVVCNWVVANKSATTGGMVSHDFVTGGTRTLPPYITSDATKTTHHYSDWKITDDGVLKGRDASDGYEKVHRGDQLPSIRAEGGVGEFRIPISKVNRVFIHDREVSQESDESDHAEWAKGMDERVWGKDHRESLSENLTGSATVEFVLNSRNSMEKYQHLYFPSRQRAQQFVDRWNALVAALRQ